MSKNSCAAAVSTESAVLRMARVNCNEPCQFMVRKDANVLTKILGGGVESFVATGQYGAKGSGRQEGQQLHGGEQGWQESAFVG